MASLGQQSTQAPQLVHFSASTLAGIFNPFKYIASLTLRQENIQNLPVGNNLFLKKFSFLDHFFN
jgi:hypothetical protein